MGIKKDVLRVTGGERITDWNKYFGIGLYGAILSLGAGILILVFPSLITVIVGLYLIFRGLLELLRYSKRKVIKSLTTFP